MSTPEPRLLVVDDEPLLCELLSLHLGSEGYSVSTAPTGEDALTAMREERPDLVLLDLMLPGLSGLDVLTSIRQTRSAHDLPVVVVSSEGGSPAIAEALRRGANDYVTKPFNFSLLAARVATLIDVSMRVREALGSEFHMLQGHALPLAPTPIGWCPRCTSVQTEASDDCVRCGGPEPNGGWIAIERSPHDYLGRVIGGSFFVDQHLGFGAAGVVYRVHDLDMHRVFASKLVQIPRDSADAVRARVIAEVKALAKVQSPHVVKIVRVARVEEDVFALVMDFVDGVTLERLISEMGRLPVADAIAIVRQVAQGLSEAHTHGLVHRDIKPANIMLEPLPAGDFFAKILDFGIVRTAAGPVAG
ncbi:MAG: CheY-like chemotaxis protein/tRNA A-37 threonylcarbamoyl transferase component Bud32, partial [Bradymonadia bacterium]